MKLTLTLIISFILTLNVTAFNIILPIRIINRNKYNIDIKYKHITGISITQRPYLTPLFAIDPNIISNELISSSNINNIGYFAAKLVSKEYLTSFLTFAFLYAGLLVALIISNIRLFNEFLSPPPTSISPSLTSAPLINLPLITPPVPLPELIAVLGRIKTLEDIGDWDAYRNRLMKMNTKELTLEGSCRWVLREDFKDTIRRGGRAKFSWPTGAGGEPIGGEDVKRDWDKWSRTKVSEVTDSTLDVVFNTWAGNTDVSERGKVEKTLEGYYKDGYLDIDKFKNAVAKARVQRLSGVAGFIGIQGILAKVFFAPAIMEFFEIQ